MDGVIHLQEFLFSEAENAALARAFREYHILPYAPKIKKAIYVLKDDVERHFVRPRVKESACEFSFNGTVLKLHEILTAPEGLTQEVTLAEGETVTKFGTYAEAETEVANRFRKYLENK